MLKIALFTLVVVLAILCTEAGKRKNKEGKDKEGKDKEGRQSAPKDCTDWTYGECIPQGEATCGKGTNKGVRTGDNCPVKEKTFACRLPCATKNKCKYQKGDWSECDLATNTMTRTNTLKKGDATLCQASKVITKKCKKSGGGRQKQNNRRRNGGSE